MSTHFKASRRELLQSGGLFAVAVCVPAAFSGCVGANVKPQVAVTINPVWEERAAQLEQGEVLTANNPGPFPGAEDAHVPTVTFDAATRSVTSLNAHPMTQAHWITTHYVRNQDGIVVGLREFRNDETMAQATFALPLGTTAVTVFSYCNVHSIWQASSTNV